jgi:hypothetical protein
MLGMRSDEFDECYASAEIQSNDHPKITTGDFKSRAFPIQNFSIWSCKTDIIH